MHAQEALSSYMLVFQSEFWHLVHDLSISKGKKKRNNDTLKLEKT